MGDMADNWVRTTRRTRADDFPEYQASRSHTATGPAAPGSPASRRHRHRRQPLDDPGAILGREPHFTRNLKSALLAAAIVPGRGHRRPDVPGSARVTTSSPLDTSQRMVEGGLQGVRGTRAVADRDYAFWDDFYRAALRDDVDWSCDVAAKKAQVGHSVVIARNGRADFGWRSDIAALRRGAGSTAVTPFFTNSSTGRR
ncbi:MAG: hypothetical protein R3D80_12685 [Paracoccaceae bacterium]